MAIRIFWLMLLLIGAYVSAGGTLSASEEEFLEVADVRIVAAERADTGKVVLAAKLAGGSVKEMTVEAFGKKYVLEQGQLDKLAGFPLTSLVMTHEAGYERLGGHTVYFKLKRSFPDANGRVVERKVVVSVSKGKGLAVAMPAPPAEEQKDE